MSNKESVLTVSDLNVRFSIEGGSVHAVKNLDLTLNRGEVLGIVGESGSGKSTVGLALMGLHDLERTEIGGSALLGGTELIGTPESEFRRIRGGRMSMIFQDSLAALSPYHRVAEQLEEMYAVHHPKATRAQARHRALEMLERVGIPDPEKRAKSFPHQFSGGMRQRVMIAMALMNEPEVVIADEPTTALDVTIQKQVLKLLTDLQADMGLSIILVTHDFGVIAETTDRTLVMYHGEKVEEGPTKQLLTAPHHPYTKALIASVPTLETVPGSRLATVSSIIAEMDKELEEGLTAAAAGDAIDAEVVTEALHDEDAPELPAFVADPDAAPLLTIENLSVHFPVRSLLLRRQVDSVRAVDDISFEIRKGESFGLVGESGSGKSTTSRVVVGLQEITSGVARFEGLDLAKASREDRLRLSREIQIVFQDPYSALNPRKTVEDIITAPLRVHTAATKQERRARAQELIDLVGLEQAHLQRYPHEFSGGQRQRIGVARALALRPKLIVADEPVSALDVSVQAQVLNLLQDLREQLGVSYLFVSHDLTVVRHFCERIAVMHHGKLVEVGTREEIFENPQHEYTKTLLTAVPELSAAQV